MMMMMLMLMIFHTNFNFPASTWWTMRSSSLVHRWKLNCVLRIQGGPKVGMQYIVYKLLYTYFWPTLYFGAT